MPLQTQHTHTHPTGEKARKTEHTYFRVLLRNTVHWHNDTHIRTHSSAHFIGVEIEIGRVLVCVCDVVCMCEVHVSGVSLGWLCDQIAAVVAHGVNGNNIEIECVLAQRAVWRTWKIPTNTLHNIHTVLVYYGLSLQTIPIPCFFSHMHLISVH